MFISQSLIILNIVFYKNFQLHDEVQENGINDLQHLGNWYQWR